MAHAPKTGISNTAASRGAITATAAAALLSVGRSTVFALARAGYIRRVHLPGMRRPRLLRADVEQLVADGFSGVRLGGGDTVEPHLLRTVRTVRTRGGGGEGANPAENTATVQPLPVPPKVPVPPFRLEARLYRPSEVAKLLGLPLPSIYVWIRAKEIRTTRIGGRYFVSPSELSRLLEGNK